MQRYFLPADQFQADYVTIQGEDAHHLLRVIRAQVGDTIICSDGMKQHVLARIRDMQPTIVKAQIIEHLAVSSEPEMDIWIAQSLPKADKMELIIQKGTELGAARFIPFVSERTIVHYDDKKEAKRTERWQKIAKEAAEQSHRQIIPHVDPVRTWKEMMKFAAEADVAWICYEKETEVLWRPAIQQALINIAHRRLLILIGPEGGFSEQEIIQAKQANIQAVSLGKRILRTETASWVALTCLLYESGEMGGR
jgi:16S rRNA (uracil1498-N3)-methyltransferase